MSELKFRTEAADLQSTPVAGYLQVSDFDEVTEILRSRKFVQGSHYEARKTIMKDTLIVLDGKDHLRRRNLLNQIFSENGVGEMRREYLLPVVERSLSEIATMPRRPDGRIPADLVVIVQRCVYRIAAAAAEIDGLDDPSTVDRMISQVKAITAGFTVEWSTEPRDKVLAKAISDQEDFRTELFDASLARRLRAVEQFRAGDIEQSEVPRDVLTMTLLHKGEAWPDDDDLRLREVCLFLSAGSQTTANGFTLFVLLLEDWLRSHPEDRGLIAEDSTFLRRAAFESLRVAATVPARLRTASEDVTLASGRHITAGQHVALLIIPANMGKTELFGDDADCYDPHREVRDTIPWGLTFGSGAHTCPGRPIVTGGRSMKAQVDVDGSIVSLARAFYSAGMELSSDQLPQREAGTHYNNYASLPVTFQAALLQSFAPGRALDEERVAVHG